MNISILCPSRGRPALAKRMADSAVQTCKDVHGLEILFYLNADDPLLSEYQQGPYQVFIVGCDGPTSYSWNELARLAAGDILMLMGDDVVFETDGWDGKLRNLAIAVQTSQGKRAVAVFSFDDGRSELGKGHPHPAMTRAAYEQLGYLACPIFRHFFVDTWLVEVAHKAGVFHYLPDVKLLHDKPWKEDTVPDETKDRIRRINVLEADEATFVLAKQRYMAADVEKLKG
jgi:hypothetical protein